VQVISQFRLPLRIDSGERPVDWDLDDHATCWRILSAVRLDVAEGGLLCFAGVELALAMAFAFDMLAVNACDRDEPNLDLCGPKDSDGRLICA
jgi:hypothetical protein